MTGDFRKGQDFEREEKIQNSTVKQFLGPKVSILKVGGGGLFLLTILNLFTTVLATFFQHITHFSPPLSSSLIDIRGLG